MYERIFTMLCVVVTVMFFHGASSHGKMFTPQEQAPRVSISQEPTHKVLKANA